MPAAIVISGLVDGASGSSRRAEGSQVSYSLYPGQRLSIGRHRTNDLIVRDERCSRHHAEIREEAGEWVIVDLESQNGTFVDGKRIQKTVLRDGQRIRIGGLRLRFVADTSSAAAGTLPDTSGLDLPDSAVADAGESAVDDGDTRLTLDDFSALCGFMADVVKEHDSRPVILCALETVKNQTGAEVVGFLGLDESGELLARMVLPSLTRLNLDMSRSLTQWVQRERCSLWLCQGHRGAISDSLAAYRDAICIPLEGGDDLLGALHAYQTQRGFQERDLRFCEAVARHLAGCLRILRLRRQLEAENQRLRSRVLPDNQLIGDSPAMLELRRAIRKAAPSAATVLIRGESGTGKELVAEALHRESLRRDGPFIVMNCAAIPANLIESQLFGHRRGAFTGADSDHEGFFQQADGGTLFLDEIGELPLECQAKLLRVLESRRFTPLAAKSEVVVDVRFIAATHRDLEKDVRDGRFRHDLYYRLQVLELHVPPLRAHGEDIPALTEHFLRQFASRGLGEKKLAPEALAQLQNQPWPGNVRQLRHTLESACILAESDTIELVHLRFAGESATKALPTLNLAELERMAFEQAFTAAGGSARAAAEMLGLSRSTFYRKAEEFGLSTDS